MILIADSGSTKTDWRLVDDQKKITQFTTQGLNPYFLSKEAIAAELKNVLLPGLVIPVTKPQIFFYGSGCGAEDKKEIIHSALREIFPEANTEVHTDLLGAARGLCGNASGIAAILGTGSNTCLYDGKIIIEQASSLGYILGDEGSGTHIGKTFISALLHHKLSDTIESSFQNRFKMGRDELLENIYRKPFPNRFLASFSKFVYQHIQETEISDLVANCFREFFDKQISGLSKNNIPFNCCGSVGFYFSNILRRVAEEKNIPVGKIVESPIAGLSLYHLGE